ncbi:hypothetical protein [Sphingomonas sp.]|uniref:hypothetical protein n=1 Tax=Sphingomonas sp. TaxID=28214 RepID=UPI003CC540CF
MIAGILHEAYPESLLQLAPPTNLDRDKITRWFLGEKLGVGAAKNKAATYVMLAQGMPENGAKTSSKPATPATVKPAKTAPIGKRAASRPNRQQKRVEEPKADRRTPQLAVNVQIHIAADAGAEQIDAIFSAMRRYFDESEAD